MFVVASFANTSSPPNEADTTVTSELSVNSNITYGLGKVVVEPTVLSPSGSFFRTGAVLSSLNEYAPVAAESCLPTVPVFVDVLASSAVT